MAIDTNDSGEIPPARVLGREYKIRGPNDPYRPWTVRRDLGGVRLLAPGAPGGNTVTSFAQIERIVGAPVPDDVVSELMADIQAFPPDTTFAQVHRRATELEDRYFDLTTLSEIAHPDSEIANPDQVSAQLTQASDDLETFIDRHRDLLRGTAFEAYLTVSGDEATTGHQPGTPPSGDEIRPWDAVAAGVDDEPRDCQAPSRITVSGTPSVSATAALDQLQQRPSAPARDLGLEL